MTFRQWCYEKWMEHCDEVEAWTGQYPGPRYLSAEYFGKYKWWLRREFRAVAQKQHQPYDPYNTVNS